MELSRVTKEDLDLSTEVEVLSYIYTGTTPREIIAHVNLGDTDGPLGGSGGTYVLRFYINDTLITPVSQVSVDASLLRTIMVSRSIPIERDDDISITVTGVSGDNDVNVVTSLRDATPLQKEDLTGGGAIAVDHNYGGDDALAVETSLGVRVDNATIRVYRREDYDAGNRGAEFVVAETETNVDGRWPTPVMLDAGDYTLLVYKQGVIQAKAVELTVA